MQHFDKIHLFFKKRFLPFIFPPLKVLSDKSMAQLIGDSLIKVN